MSAQTPQRGYFAAGEFASLLRGFVRQLATGRLDVTGDGGARHLWLDAGQVRSVVSELEEEKLGNWLMSRGLLQPHQMAIALLRQPEGVRYGAFLVREGLLPAEKLEEELEGQSVGIVSRMLFDPADYVFHAGEQLPSDAASLEMTTAMLLASAVRTIADDAKLLRLLDPAQYLCGARDAVLLYQKVQLTPQEGFLLSRVDGTTTPVQLRRSVGLAPADATKALAVLRAVGLVEQQSRPAARPVPASGEHPRVEPKREKPEDTLQYTREQHREYDEIIRLADECRHKDLYSRLGLSPGATQDQIHSRFLEFARLYHPDRAREPHLRSLRRELAEIYGAVQEADETLVDPERRARYDQSYRDGEGAPKADAVGEEKRRTAREALVKANLVRAKELIRTGDVGMAIQLLDQVVRLEPDAESLLMLARLEFRNPMWVQRGLDHLKHAVALAPRSTETWLELANFWGVRGMRERQRQCLDKILEFDPKNPDVQLALAAIKEGSRKSKRRS